MKKIIINEFTFSFHSINRFILRGNYTFNMHREKEFDKQKNKYEKILRVYFLMTYGRRLILKEQIEIAKIMNEIIINSHNVKIKKDKEGIFLYIVKFKQFEFIIDLKSKTVLTCNIRFKNNKLYEFHKNFSRKEIYNIHNVCLEEHTKKGVNQIFNNVKYKFSPKFKNKLKDNLFNKLIETNIYRKMELI